MKISETNLKGCFLLEPKVFVDKRGLFFESFKKNELEKALGYKVSFVQENQSISKRGVLRGLHFQKGDAAQAKLVKVVKGEVLDVIVDIRKDSPTFGQHFKIRLTAENKKMLFIPRGIAHGFLSLSEEVIFTYKCDNYYHHKAESGILYNDADLGIDWEFPQEQILLSPKDLQLPLFKTIIL